MRSGERTLRLLVERFNEQGIDGLIYRPPSGRPRKLGGEVAATILPLVDDPASAGQNPWDRHQALLMAPSGEGP